MIELFSVKKKRKKVERTQNFQAKKLPIIVKLRTIQQNIFSLTVAKIGFSASHNGSIGIELFVVFFSLHERFR